MKPTIILIGGSGLVGTVFQSTLSSTYRVLDFSFPQIDVCNRALIRSILEKIPDVIGVINLAAATDTNLAYTDSEYQQICWQINDLGADNVAKVCRQLGLKLVHVSTDYVYSGQKITPYVESDIPDPIEPYGQSKAAGEKKVLDSGGLVATLAFPFTPSPMRPDIIAKAIQSLSSSRPVYAFNDQYICPTFLPDFSDGIVRLLNSPQAQGKYHLVGPPTTPYDLRLAIARHFQLSTSALSPSSVREYNQKALLEGKRIYQANLTLSTNKFFKLTGFRVRSLESALKLFQ